MASDSPLYLDNAATSFPKPEGVYAAVDDAMRRSGANPGRGSHALARAADEIVLRARANVARLLSAGKDTDTIFTYSCTDGLNLVLKSLAGRGHRAVIGPFEHNAVYRPLYALQTRGLELAVARATPDGRIDLDDFAARCAQGVDFAVVAHASNVTGARSPVPEIARIVHRCGGILVVDGAQSAGHIPIDLQELGADIFVCPGHKGLLGPMGTGIVIVPRTIPLDPLRAGGTGVHSEDPDMPLEPTCRLEAGTHNLPGIAGLSAGIDWLSEVGVERVAAHERACAARLIEGLATIDGVRVLSDAACGTGIVSFTMDGLTSEEVGNFLDQAYGIYTRSGLHCAPLAHRALGTFPEGTVRASVGWSNSEEDVARLVSAVREIRGNFG